MSRPTPEQVAYGLYRVSMRLDGWCPYCDKEIIGMPFDYVQWHYEQEHTPKSKSPQPRANASKGKG